MKIIESLVLNDGGALVIEMGMAKVKTNHSMVIENEKCFSL